MWAEPDSVVSMLVLECDEMHEIKACLIMHPTFM